MLRNITSPLRDSRLFFTLLSVCLLTSCGSESRQNRFNEDGSPFVFDVIAVSPFHNSTYNSGQTTLVLTFNSAVDPSTVDGNIRIYQETSPNIGTSIINQEVTTSLFNSPPTLSSDGRSLIYTVHQGQTLPAAKYITTMNSYVRDTYGSFLADQKYSEIKLNFWVGSPFGGGIANDPTHPPHAVSIVKRKLGNFGCNGLMVVVNFNESLESPPVMYFKYKDAYLGLNNDTEYKKWQNVNTLTPHSIGTTDLLSQKSWHAYLPIGYGSCIPGRAYRLVIDSATDIDGNTMSSTIVLPVLDANGVQIIDDNGTPNDPSDDFPKTENKNGHDLSAYGVGQSQPHTGVDADSVISNGSLFTESETFGPFLGL
ncbi:MAG: Ig-like domain-containing protein [Bdellovibrionota bacterium]